jgi:peptidyl-prolyl cis-trans isomerase SurA
MRPGFLRFPAVLLCGALATAAGAMAQTQASQPQSLYGGTTVEDIVARVNDQIITQSDYDHAMQEMDAEGRQQGKTMQQISAAHRDLLRSLIDQQLWLSKGKELGITGDTELVKRLDEIRKQYNLATIEDLEAAAKEQGVSYEDFKQNIRNQIITQEVMRQQVGAKIQFTPGEAEQYYEQHKQEYAQQESERLSEILVSTGDNPDQAKIDAAKAKADDIVSRLKAGSDFAQLARNFSDGPTAAQGGDLGQFRRGALAKVLEDATFALKQDQWTDPIRTRQGYVILKVTQHVGGGPAPFKDVQNQVEETLYMERMEPAIRAYLTTMREQAFLDIKTGYTDTGASPNQTKPIFSAYVPPAPKKKAKVERTRYRENTRSFRQKTKIEPVSAAPAAPAATAAAPAAKTKKAKSKVKDTTEKAGKREKIRFGQAPRNTLPTASAKAETVNAGALPEQPAATETASSGNEPVNPLEPTAPTTKTRFSKRALTEKKVKKAAPAPAANSYNATAPAAPEVADRSTQAAPLGLNGDTGTKKKKAKPAATTGEKTRLSKEKKTKEKTPVQMTPAPAVPGAPAPADAPKPQP